VVGEGGHVYVCSHGRPDVWAVKGAGIVPQRGWGNPLLADFYPDVVLRLVALFEESGSKASLKKVITGATTGKCRHILGGTEDRL
jgi:hypothetical protein